MQVSDHAVLEVAFGEDSLLEAPAARALEWPHKQWSRKTCGVARPHDKSKACDGAGQQCNPISRLKNSSLERYLNVSVRLPGAVLVQIDWHDIDNDSFCKALPRTQQGPAGWHVACTVQSSGQSFLKMAAIDAFAT